jgi:hypothetical protein
MFGAAQKAGSRPKKDIAWLTQAKENKVKELDNFISSIEVIQY